MSRPQTGTGIFWPHSADLGVCRLNPNTPGCRHLSPKLSELPNLRLNSGFTESGPLGRAFGFGFLPQKISSKTEKTRLEILFLATNATMIRWGKVLAWLHAQTRTHTLQSVPY
jgi:hypothetical protein